jgi:hypothetical protein
MSDRPPVDPFPDPQQLVVGVIGDEEGGQRASEALLHAGFAPDSIVVLHGEEDARRLDVAGEEHGRGGKLIRALQAALSFDRDHVRRHAAHLRSGDSVVGVTVGEDEDARQRAVDVLRAAGGSFINYYGDNYIQSYASDPHASQETRPDEPA